MTITTDLDYLAHSAEENEAANEDFKTLLKSLDPALVDRWVMELNQQVSAAIDCTTCGNCCTRLMVNVDDAAIDRLSTHLGLSEIDFRKRFVETGSFMQFLNAIPCQFLQGKKCGVYQIRPHECREFPRLDRPGFTKRLFATFSHYGMCPIIFNVVEGLKEKVIERPL